MIPIRTAADTGPAPAARNWLEPAFLDRLLVPIELFTGGSALICGTLLVLQPDGALMRLPLWVLAGSPFTDWQVPGLLLSGFVGLGFLAASGFERCGYRHRRQVSVLAGVGLVVFEAFEWKWLGFHPLQAVFMAVGAGVIYLATGSGTTRSVVQLPDADLGSGSVTARRP